MTIRVGAIALLLVTQGCGGLVGPDPSADNVSVFDLVWADFDRHYASFEGKHIDWNAKRESYRPQAIAATSDAALAQVIGAMLVELQDVHVTLYTPGKAYRYTGYEAQPYFFDAALVFSSTYVPSSRVTASQNIRAGRIGSKLLYAWIPSLNGAGWDGDMDEVLRDSAGISGVIIDIRDNGGGNNGTGRAIVGRFTDAKRLFAYTRFRSGAGHADFTDYAPEHIDRRGARHFSGPVVLLTSRRNFSAAEDFAQAMRMLPNVTIVGDTTGGGSSNPVHHELPNGWTYRLSEGLLYDVNKQSLEDVGIPPTIFIRQTQADTDAKVDAVLERACGVLGVPRCGRP